MVLVQLDITHRHQALCLDQVKQLLLLLLNNVTTPARTAAAAAYLGDSDSLSSLRQPVPFCRTMSPPLQGHASHHTMCTASLPHPGDWPALLLRGGRSWAHDTHWQLTAQHAAIQKHMRGCPVVCVQPACMPCVDPQSERVTTCCGPVSPYVSPECECCCQVAGYLNNVHIRVVGLQQTSSDKEKASEGSRTNAHPSLVSAATLQQPAHTYY